MFAKRTYRKTRWIEQAFKYLCEDGDGPPPNFRPIKSCYNIEVQKHEFDVLVVMERTNSPDPEMLRVSHLRIGNSRNTLQCFCPPQNGSYPNGAIIELAFDDKERLIVLQKDVS